MKKTLILFFLTAFCTISAFSAPRITIHQSYRYEGGKYADLDTPVIQMEKVKRAGGKVYFKYDFEITETDKPSFWQNPPGDIVILIKFPTYDCGNGYSNSIFWGEDFLKVTSLSGARDLTKDILNAASGTESYSIIQKSIGRLPKGFFWYICDRTQTRDFACYIPLVMENKQGNRASLEFYIDIGEISEGYLSWDEEEKAEFSWIEELLHEIPIDISFHDRNCITAWNFSIDSKYEYDSKTKSAIKKITGFVIIAEDFYSWQNSYSGSNHSVTLMIR